MPSLISHTHLFVLSCHCSSVFNYGNLCLLLNLSVQLKRLAWILKCSFQQAKIWHFSDSEQQRYWSDCMHALKGLCLRWLRTRQPGFLLEKDLRTYATKYFPHWNLFNTLQNAWIVYLWNQKVMSPCSTFLNLIWKFSAFDQLSQQMKD